MTKSSWEFKTRLASLISMVANSGKEQATPRICASVVKGVCRLAVAVILLSPLMPIKSSYAAGRVFFDDFEDGTTNKWAQADFRNKCAVVNSAIDGGSPRSGTRMARCNWNGTVAWNDPAAYESSALNSWSYSTEFLIRVWVRADADVDHKFGNKRFRLFFNGGVNDYFWDGQMERSGGPIYSNIGTVDGVTGNFNNYGSAPIGDGLWHKVEVYFKVGLGGTSIMRTWVAAVVCSTRQSASRPIRRASGIRCISCRIGRTTGRSGNTTRIITSIGTV